METKKPVLRTQCSAGREERDRTLPATLSLTQGTALAKSNSWAHSWLGTPLRTHC